MGYEDGAVYLSLPWQGVPHTRRSPSLARFIHRSGIAAARCWPLTYKNGYAGRIEDNGRKSAEGTAAPSTVELCVSWDAGTGNPAVRSAVSSVTGNASGCSSIAITPPGQLAFVGFRGIGPVFVRSSGYCMVLSLFGIIMRIYYKYRPLICSFVAETC